jgi:hypothetical protein
LLAAGLFLCAAQVRQAACVHWRLGQHAIHWRDAQQATHQGLQALQAAAAAEEEQGKECTSAHRAVMDAEASTLNTSAHLNLLRCVLQYQQDKLHSNVLYWKAQEQPAAQGSCPAGTSHLQHNA